jgi:hypothetical protein
MNTLCPDGSIGRTNSGSLNDYGGSIDTISVPMSLKLPFKNFSFSDVYQQVPPVSSIIIKSFNSDRTSR